MDFDTQNNLKILLKNQSDFIDNSNSNLSDKNYDDQNVQITD